MPKNLQNNSQPKTHSRHNHCENPKPRSTPPPTGITPNKSKSNDQEQPPIHGQNHYPIAKIGRPQQSGAPTTSNPQQITTINQSKSKKKTQQLNKPITTPHTGDPQQFGVLATSSAQQISTINSKSQPTNRIQIATQKSKSPHPRR